MPRALCTTFLPDDANENSVYVRVIHQGDGDYGLGVAGIAISIDVDEAGDCAWIIDGYASHGIYETLPIEEVGCLTDSEGDTLEVPDITIDGESGTLRIAPIPGIIVPAIENEGGCLEWLCSNCQCLPGCLCVTYDYPFDTIIIPEVPGYVRQQKLACWDAGRQGWYVDFDEINCVPGASILVELLRDEDEENCQLYLTAGTLDQEPSETALDCEDVSGRWTFDNSELDEDVYEPEEVKIAVNPISCGTCLTRCCIDLPETLTVTMEQVVGECDPPPDPPGFQCPIDPGEGIEFTLNFDCDEREWFGSITLPVCEEFPEPLDPPENFTLEVRVNCFGCFSRGDDTCMCLCDSSASPGSDDGCLMMDFQTKDDMGNVLAQNVNKVSFCGYHGFLDEFIESSCDPIYGEWIENQSILGEQCGWRIIITE